ncbi:Inner-membrane translocator [Mesorhizobium plurifarium]|uniref:Inner-membrane translocator n=1 Tax=Mesorhizobium plurifarium TaxID=69974 RepID=A0A090GVT1_MESPL|nr:Inner-membrane translocator [Mesorhizobium plurifarium]CDX61227.1 Inner-membrane translocator [Mesorhizobium plurifarium]
MSVSANDNASKASMRGFLAKYSVLIAFAAIVIFFAVASPTFLTPANLFNVLVNNVVMLAIVALGLTIVISSGGIDLSVGVSVDMASMIFVMLLAAGYSGVVGVAGGLGAALIVGILNAILITRLNISPFLATLGVLFIGQSTQQLATSGGQPIYLTSGYAADQFNAIARTALFGIPTPVIVLIVLAVAVHLLLHRSVFGRYVQAMGAQPGVAWYSGIRVPRELSMVHVLCALLAGVTGILLSATVKSYVPLSGNAFLLDAIGATFIGTTLSRERKPSVIGTLLGVLLLAIVKNGLLLVGWNFYWQQVGIGVLVFLVLAASFGLRRAAH